VNAIPLTKPVLVTTALLIAQSILLLQPVLILLTNIRLRPGLLALAVLLHLSLPIAHTPAALPASRAARFTDPNDTDEQNHCQTQFARGFHDTLLQHKLSGPAASLPDETPCRRGSSGFMVYPACRRVMSRAYRQVSIGFIKSVPRLTVLS
jgi:hypothetical protein